MHIKHLLRNLPVLLLLFFSFCSREKVDDSSGHPVRYTEAYRPQFHFTPDSMWMNDPNGMVYYEGEYHLFYQHHPYSNVWGPMHWGHAISRDLVHWEHLPIALYPDSLGTIFSGSAVIDWENTSGLGSSEHPPMVAIFTQHNQSLAESGSDLFQNQSIAYSLDKGRSWAKYTGNPVLENPGIRDFRDPKIIWMEKTGTWIMTLAAQDRIMFYSSPNLINWTIESEFGANTGAHGGVWECPDLFPLSYEGDTIWVLLVSINPGGPSGGSATQYFVGDFNGLEFRNAYPGTEPAWIDYGKDNYAGVTWSDIPAGDGRRIILGWMSNWQYATLVPTEKWKSAMTLPRELRLGKKEEGYYLRSLPLSETEQLRIAELDLEPGALKNISYKGRAPDKGAFLYELDLVFEFDPEEKEGLEFGIMFESAQSEKLMAGFNTGTRQVFIDRRASGESGFSKEFPGIHTAPYPVPRAGEISFHAFVDLSSIELFVDQGALVMTELCFPEAGFEKISLFTNKESVRLKQGTIYALKSIW